MFSPLTEALDPGGNLLRMTIALDSALAARALTLSVYRDPELGYIVSLTQSEGTTFAERALGEFEGGVPHEVVYDAAMELMGLSGPV